MAAEIVKDRVHMYSLLSCLQKEEHIALDTEYYQPAYPWEEQLYKSVTARVGKMRPDTDEMATELMFMSVCRVSDEKVWLIDVKTLGTEDSIWFVKRLWATEGVRLWWHNMVADLAAIKWNRHWEQKCKLGDTMRLVFLLNQGVPVSEHGRVRFKHGLKEVAELRIGMKMKSYAETVAGFVQVAGPTEDELAVAFKQDMDALFARCAPKVPTKKLQAEVRREHNKRKAFQRFRLKDMRDVTAEDVASYAGDDALATARLVKKYWPEMKKYGNQGNYVHIWDTVDMPCILLSREMRDFGMPVNVPYFEALRERLRGECEHIEQVWAEKVTAAGATSISLRKDHEVVTCLYKELKCWPLGPQSYTDTGGLSAGKDAVAFALQRCPEGSLGRELALLRREFSKKYALLKAYIPAIVNHGTYYADGCIHSKVAFQGPETGRWAGKSPNIHSIPADMIRQGFVAPEGWSFVEADFSSFEIVIIGHFSKDARITEICLTGKSQHDVTAEALGIERKKAKQINLGLNYEMGAVTLSNSMMIPLVKKQKRDGTEYWDATDEVKSWLEKYNETYEGVIEFRKKVHESVETKGYVKTLFGRRRTLHDVWSPNKGFRAKALRQAGNTIIQGTAADIMNASLVAMWELIRKEGRKTRIVMQIHDAIVCLTPDNERDQCIEDLKRIMSTTVKLSLPLSADIKSGKTWAECK